MVELKSPGQLTGGEAAKPSALMQRVLVGAALGMLALAAIWLGGWVFKLLLLMIGLLVVIEFTAVTGSDASTTARIVALAGVGAAWGAAAFHHPVTGIVIADIVTLALVIFAVALRHRAMFWSGLSVLYVSAAMVALVWLRDGENGRIIVLWLVLTVAVTDTAAFFTGRTLGGPKLAPSISPNKTWSGMIGGMVGAALAGGLLATAMGFASPLLIGLLSAGVAVVAQMGDLLESHLKRSFGVKDSGTMLPGHGGIMDRVDGYMLASPVVALAMLPAGLIG